ncbi:MAG: acyltransferase family protein [Clostridium sp.]|nr:acyltransferase family protein [Clostridium sp.]
MSECVNVKDIKCRYEWVDVLKALGIIAIYLGHFGKDGGKLYPFVFEYHVPLFFLISGFFAMEKNIENFKYYFKKKFQRIMIPFFSFSIIYEVIYVLNNQISGSEIIQITIKSFMGIRNNTISPSLWFLPCLFIMYMMNYLLVKILKNKYLILAVAFLFMLSTQTVFNNNPLVTPSWIWNIDSAVYYYVYFSLGNIYFNMVNRFINSKSSFRKKLITSILLIFVVVFAAIVYLKGSWYFVKDLHLGLFLVQIYIVLSTLILISANTALSMTLVRIPLFVQIGKNTLILCCAEGLIKSLLQSIITIFGLTLELTTPFDTLIYTFLCVLISYFTLVPFFKSYFPKIIGIYRDNNIAL